MRLTEFYAVDEGMSRHFTIEPRNDGNAVLLAWESGILAEAADADMSYQQMAHGDIEKIISVLRKVLPESKEFEDDIRQSFEQALYEDAAVRIDGSGTEIIGRLWSNRLVEGED